MKSRASVHQVRPFSPFGRGFCVPLFLLLLLPLALIPWSAGQAEESPSPSALQEAIRRTGLSKEELLRLYRQQGALPTQAESAAPDSTQSPGRTELPPGQTGPIATTPARPELPMVILPLETERGLSTLKITSDSLARAKSRPVKTTSGVFGVDFFHLEPGVFSQSSFGPVPADYVIGVGDQVVIDVWGEVEFRLERVVDRDGSIILPKGGKILAAGKTLAQTKEAVRERLARSYSGLSRSPDDGTTFLDVTLGKLRAIRIFVVGDVTQPGAYELSSIATIFSALYAAGGPSASGSMRDVRLMRGDQKVAEFDLYSYLLEGNRKDDVILREYDTVFLPPRGKTVVLSGEVRRPLTFEMKEGETLVDLLRFGGGFTSRAAAEVIHVQRILSPEQRRPGKPDRTQTDIQLDAGTGRPIDPTQASLRDGDVVSVGAVSDRLENWVGIAGAVKRPGHYAFAPGLDLAGLVALAGQTWPDAVGQRAILDRVAPDGTYQSYDVALDDVLSGRTQPLPLQPLDQLQILSKWEIQDRGMVAITGEVRHPGEFSYREGMTLLDLILKAGGLQESADASKVQISRLRQDAVSAIDPTTPPDNVVDIIDVSLGNDFLSTAASPPLQPHDQVSVRRLPWWESTHKVSLRGEVLYPGVYTLRRPDETLSEVLERAGGLKSTAFSPGARAIRSRDGLGNIGLDLASALRHPHSPDDLIMQSGDEIVIPPIPQTVKVVGAVGYPTSVLYKSGKSAGHYIGHAGGYAEGAARGKTRVVQPNGLSRPLHRFWRDPPVMAGSTIVVPFQEPTEKTPRLDTLGKLAGIIASLATVWLVADRTSKN
jgi:polysaccharide biosynthesis/export protein